MLVFHWSELYLPQLYICLWLHASCLLHPSCKTSHPGEMEWKRAEQLLLVPTSTSLTPPVFSGISVWTDASISLFLHFVIGAVFFLVSQDNASGNKKIKHIRVVWGQSHGLLSLPFFNFPNFCTIFAQFVHLLFLNCRNLQINVSYDCFITSSLIFVYYIY